jgi:hypothetical protein
MTERRTMKSMKLSPKLLLCLSLMSATLVLGLTGCQGGSGGSATTEPSAGAAGTDTNSPATNAPATTNASQ